MSHYDSSAGSAPSLTTRRVLYYFFCSLVFLLIVALWLLYWFARRPLPQLDGKLPVPGISAQVRVVRDEQGVPTIEATNLEDLFFAQGYVTAQDRLWQMDIMRRAAAGELSEIIGEDTVKMDREQRILGLRPAAENAVGMIPPAQKQYFEAYARGVNAFLESHRDRLSLEFRLLKYTPKPWTVTDTLLVGVRMVEDLNHNSQPPALTREKILARLGPELTKDLYVNSSWHDRPPGEVRKMDQAPPGDQSGEDEDDEEVDTDGSSRLTSSLRQNPSAGAGVGASQFALEEIETFRPGSNNWVVSGQHTVTGKPLLSNDMHLDHQMPNLWFEAHLKCADFDVAGVTLPGVPFVIVGHNQRVGWGFTNVGPTVEDDFVEEFNSDGQYKTPAGWKDPGHRQEVIHVKGKPDVVLDVLSTRHGPIVTELLPGETRKIALRWTVQDGMALMFFDVNSARNWEEFRKAFSGFFAPGQNVMYADVDGHIGYQATGRVPIRASGDGSMPVSGSDDAHEWKSWIPFDDMPRVFDPPGGILASANGRIAPDGYKYSISTEWDTPWRTDRIYRVLESGKKFSPSDMLALQMDVSSAYDRFCADKFVYAIDHTANASERAKRAADILRDWDGRMSAGSAAPTIETKARQELVRLLLEPKLGPAPSGPDHGELNWKSYRWAMSSIWLENVLTREPARWLPPGYPDYAALLTTAVDNIVTSAKISAGSVPASTAPAPVDLSQWKWGANYQVDIEHLVLNQIPLMGRLTGPGTHPLSGSALTVKAVGRGFGPSERLTWNFADFDQSTLNTVTGESGIFLSPHYMDQWQAWYEGRTFTFPFSTQAVEQHKQHEMVLTPGK